MDDKMSEFVRIPKDAGDRLGEDFLRALFNGMSPFTTCLNVVIATAAERFPQADLVSQPASVGYDQRKDFRVYNENGTTICCRCGKKILTTKDQFACDFCLTKKSPPPLVTPDAARAALNFMDKYFPSGARNGKSGEVVETIRTLLQQAAHDKGDGGGGKDV